MLGPGTFDNKKGSNAMRKNRRFVTIGFYSKDDPSHGLPVRCCVCGRGHASWGTARLRDGTDVWLCEPCLLSEANDQAREFFEVTEENKATAERHVARPTSCTQRSTDDDEECEIKSKKERDWRRYPTAGSGMISIKLWFACGTSANDGRATADGCLCDSSRATGRASRGWL